jgi:hypothetical protein
MICVFDVIEGPARGKRFWVRPDQLIEIGRISSADFSVPTDQHMSRHHLIIEATADSFRVRDVGSANGTFVNDAKITAVVLCNGDKIRAGITTLEVSFIGDNDSPHARDGLALSHNEPSKPPAVTENSVITQRLVELPEYKTDRDDTNRFPPIKNATGGALAPEYLDAPLTRHAEHGLTNYFSPSPVPNLHLEAVDFRSLGLDLPRLLQRYEGETDVSFIINTAQLGKFQLNSIEQWLATDRISKIASDHFLLESDGSEEVWDFLNSVLYRDAIICVGSTKPLQMEWLASKMDIFRYPSTLTKYLQTSTHEQRDALLQHVEFLIFERDKSGKLGLFCGDLMRGCEKPGTE